MDDPTGEDAAWRAARALGDIMRLLGDSGTASDDLALPAVSVSNSNCTTLAIVLVFASFVHDAISQK